MSSFARGRQQISLILRICIVKRKGNGRRPRCGVRLSRIDERATPGRPITDYVSPSSPIVVLDSGLGGLTVVRAIRQALPHDDVLYFGDPARLPYGSKSADTVTTFVRQIIRYLRPYEPKHVVIGCNTAT